LKINPEIIHAIETGEGLVIWILAGITYLFAIAFAFYIYYRLFKEWRMNKKLKGIREK
jgi:hypothetical protein